LKHISAEYAASSHKLGSDFMRHNRIRAVFLSSIFVAATVAAVPAMAQTPYDGLWNVTIVTKTGTCEHQPVQP